MASDQEYRIIGSSEPIRRLKAAISLYAKRDRTAVLITGETGTGKELAARSLHRMGPRSSEPFVALNMSVTPDGLYSSHLFGHKKGAFTGAHTDRTGYFAHAGSGTLFLDEITTMPVEAQGILLRAIESRTYTKVGGTREECIDSRMICATNADMYSEISAGRFREDLFYRLSAIELNVPPLRERLEDIPLLARHFLTDSEYEDIRGLMIDGEAMSLLMEYDYPGNVRELKSIVENAAFLVHEGKDILGMAEMEQVFANKGKRSTLESVAEDHKTLRDVLHLAGGQDYGRFMDSINWTVRKVICEEAVHNTGGNLSKASRMLGISRKYLKCIIDRPVSDELIDDGKKNLMYIIKRMDIRGR